MMTEPEQILTWLRQPEVRAQFSSAEAIEVLSLAFQVEAVQDSELQSLRSIYRRAYGDAIALGDLLN